MPAQLNDILYAERLGIPGTITVDEVVEYSRQSVNQHSDSNIDFPNSLDGDELVIVGGIIRLKPRPIIIESIDGQWQTSTNDFDTPITDPAAGNTNVAISVLADFRETGLWKPYVSFLYSSDSTGSDFEARCLVDNVSIAKCQTNDGTIIKEEAKDAAGQSPDNPSAGTSQVKSYNNEFHAFNVSTIGEKSIVLLFGPETGGVEANIGEITIEFRRVYNIQKP